MSFTEIGRGFSCAAKSEVMGEIKFIQSPSDVVELIKGDPNGRICLIEQSGATTLGPIFKKIGAVLCTSGSKGSHLAIVSREFEIPAFMSTKFLVPLTELNGKKVKLTTSSDGQTGIVYLID